MIAFLKPLRFWRYRALYLSLVQEHAAAGYDVQKNYHQAMTFSGELNRLQAILAPYGERILTGQAKGTEGPIRLPALEFEMARAYLYSISRVPSEMRAGGFKHYGWHGRLLKRIG